MKKNFILVLFLISISGCGFEPIYKNANVNDLKINFEIVKTGGNNEINEYIINNLNHYLNSNLNKKYKINLNTVYSKSGIANNKKKETTAYLIKVETEFELLTKDKTEKINFNENIKINKLSNSFDQKNYENKIKREISKSIVIKLVNKIFTINDN